MKKLLTAITILISLQTQAQTVPASSSTTFTYQQVKNLVKKTADSVRNEYKAAISLLVIRLNNQNDDRIALSKVIDSVRLDIAGTFIMDIDSLKKIFDFKNVQDSVKISEDKIIVLENLIELIKQYIVLQKQKYLELSQ